MKISLHLSHVGKCINLSLHCHIPRNSYLPTVNLSTYSYSIIYHYSSLILNELACYVYLQWEVSLSLISLTTSTLSARGSWIQFNFTRTALLIISICQITQTKRWQERKLSVFGANERVTTFPFSMIGSWRKHSMNPVEHYRFKTQMSSICLSISLSVDLIMPLMRLQAS